MRRAGLKRRILWGKPASGAGEQGSSLVEFALVMPILMLLLIGVVDIARAYYLGIEITGAAEAAANYGITAPNDATGIRAAAAANAPDAGTLTVTKVYGCECSDGSNFISACTSTPTCTSTTLVNRITIPISATYTPLFPWPGIPTSITLKSTATVRNGTS